MSAKIASAAKKHAAAGEQKPAAGAGAANKAEAAAQATDQVGTVDAVDIIEHLFKLVIEEARSRPAFAKKLVKVFPRDMMLAQPAVRTARKSKSGHAFDPVSVNPVVIVREKGEDALKFELGKRRAKKELLAIIRVHNLDVPARVRKSGATSVSWLSRSR